MTATNWRETHTCQEDGPPDCIPCVTAHAGPPSSSHVCGGETASWECPACREWDAARMDLRKILGPPPLPSRRSHATSRRAKPVARRRASLPGYVKQKIPAILRRQVMERDAYRCRICLTWIDLSIDHVYPEALGGPTELDNLQTLCRPCNSRKGVKVP